MTLATLPRFALLLATVAWLAGCALGAADTPQQRLFALSSDFRSAVSAMAAYCEQPEASASACVRASNAADTGAMLIATLELAVQDGSLSDSDVANALRILATLIEQIQAAPAEAAEEGLL